MIGFLFLDSSFRLQPISRKTECRVNLRYVQVPCVYLEVQKSKTNFCGCQVSLFRCHLACAVTGRLVFSPVSKFVVINKGDRTSYLSRTTRHVTCQTLLDLLNPAVCV